MVLPSALGGGIERGAEVMMHELVHYINDLCNIKDTSRKGRYHNAKFEKSAKHAGLLVTKSEYGWTLTALSKELSKAVVAWAKDEKIDRSVFRFVRMESKAGRTLGRLSCKTCGQFAYVAIRRIEETKLICGRCNTLMVKQSDGR